MRLGSKLLAAVALLLAAALPATAVELLPVGKGGQPIRLEAEELHSDNQQQHYEASGNAVLQQDDLTLRADRVWWNKVDNRAGAVGNVRLEAAGGILEGADLSVQLEDGTATVKQGRAQLAGQNLQLAGEEIARIGEQSYRIRSGTFTACAGTPPAWKFGANEASIDIGGYARAKHVVFYLHDIPVLYLPYLLYPIKTERESGMLVPHLGYSQLRGGEVALAYYQVLGRNMDATLFLDTYTRAGLGKGLEYRYLFSGNTGGELNGYHLSGFNEFADVGSLSWRHGGQLGGGVRLRVDAEYVSDYEYLTNFGVEAADYNRDLVESYLSVSRAWGKTDLSLQGSYLKDFNPQRSSDPPSTLPEARVAVIPQRLGNTPLYLRFELAGNNVSRSSSSSEQSLKARPALRLVTQPLAGVSLEGEGGYTGYLVERQEGGEQLDFYDLRARLSSRLERTYPAPQPGGTVLRHSIEPELGYVRVQDRDQEAFTQLLPDDLATPTDRLLVAVNTRLTSRQRDTSGAAVSREWLLVRLASGYNLGERDNHPRTFEPVTGELRAKPSDWLNVRADAGYGLASGEHQWQTLSGGLTLGDSRRQLAVSYYLRDADEVNYLAARLRMPLLTERVQIEYAPRLSLDDVRFLENMFNLEYRGSCWSVTLTARIRPGEREFLVNFSLAGLGKSSGFFNKSP